ncbi:MAG: hypothetical protein JWP91_1111 [Fibrobacteres bacterium]|nr:hypothetical protein [Fibrobacterota bacterium]
MRFLSKLFILPFLTLLAISAKPVSAATGNFELNSCSQIEMYDQAGSTSSVIRIANWNCGGAGTGGVQAELYQKDTTPGYFSLVYNALKDYSFRNSSGRMFVYWDNASGYTKIIMVLVRRT